MVLYGYGSVRSGLCFSVCSWLFKSVWLWLCLVMALDDCGSVWSWFYMVMALYGQVTVFLYVHGSLCQCGCGSVWSFLCLSVWPWLCLLVGYCSSYLVMTRSFLYSLAVPVSVWFCLLMALPFCTVTHGSVSVCLCIHVSVSMVIALSHRVVIGVSLFVFKSVSS